MTAITPLRLLVVDDQDSVRAVVRMIVEAHFAGALITEAANGRDAVAMAATEQPDVIIMDIMMPVLNGFEATKQILAAQPRAKIIMFSGNRSRDLIAQAREIGGVGYLFKPCQPSELVRAVHEVQGGQTVFPPGEAA